MQTYTDMSKIYATKASRYKASQCRAAILEEMWAALLTYLPQAIARGHGESWKRMCSEKTNAAAARAAAAWDAAADAAYAAAWDAARADYMARRAQKAIDLINKGKKEIK